MTNTTKTTATEGARDANLSALNDRIEYLTTQLADREREVRELRAREMAGLGGIDIIGLATEAMREAGQLPHVVCTTSYRHAYWTLAQMVAHHTVNGCNLQSGDLLGTGTLSGPTLDQACALIELTCGGKHPIALPNGEQRAWLNGFFAGILSLEAQTAASGGGAVPSTAKSADGDDGEGEPEPGSL